jgi:hypothetical protein
MMPYGNFSAIIVGFAIAANLVKGVAEGDRVDVGTGFVMVVELPSGV